MTDKAGSGSVTRGRVTLDGQVQNHDRLAGGFDSDAVLWRAIRHPPAMQKRFLHHHMSMSRSVTAHFVITSACSTQCHAVI